MSLLVSGTAAAAVAALCLAGPAVAAGGGSTLLVGNNAKCAGAQYTTIGAAVAAASAGDTIKVCAGIYPETVDVDKQLTFLGAESGKDGRTKRTKLKKESVVASAGGDFVIAPGVSGVVINGFTLEGAGSSGNTDDAVEAFSGGSGFTIVDNVIENNELGVNVQNPDPTQPTEIAHNAFIDNSTVDSAQSGTGVFISNGPADSTTIEDNSFTGDDQAAVNTAGTTSNLSTGLVIADNTSVNDATFLVATNTVDALVDGNAVSVTANGPDNGSAILDFGSNQSLRITDNTVKGGATSGTSGIRIANDTGTASTGTTVVDNVVAGRYNGIRVTGGYTDLLVSGNTVSGSANDGILVADGSGNVLSRNKVSASAGHDCEDDTVGSLTAGTADTWRHDSGTSGNSTPAGICS